MNLFFTQVFTLVALPSGPPLRVARSWRRAAVLLALASTGAAGPVRAQTLTNRGATVVVRAGAALVVRGSVSNAAGSTLTNAGTLRLTGDLTNAGTLTSAGWLVFAGALDQTLAPGQGSVAQVEVRNSGSAGSNHLLLPTDLTLTGQLLLTQGLVRTAAPAWLTLPPGATVQGEGPGRYVQGNLRVVRDLVSGVVDFGNGLVLDATGSPLGTVTATRTAGLATANVSYATNLSGGPARGIDRIWALASTQAPTKALPLTLSWLADDDNGLTDFSAARVWQQPSPGLAWVAAGAPTAAPTRSISTTVTTLSRLTVSNAANPLPVELTRFTAERQGEAAWLRWATASERNHARFEVESSADGRQFRRLATQASRSPAGLGAAYEAQDANLARYGVETVYYRLRQLDQDSTVRFSPVRAVATLASAGRLRAYPNPFREAVTVALDASSAGPAALVLCDGLGRTVWQQTVVLARGANALALTPPAQLPPGIYVLTITQGAQQRRLTLTRY